MSQPAEIAPNGSTQHIKPEIQDGVKVVPGNTINSAPAQQINPSTVGPQSPIVNDQNQRPVLRRVDSRGAFPHRQPGPYSNPPVQQQGQQGTFIQGSATRPPQPRPQPPLGTHFTIRPPVNLSPRFPNQQPLQRHNPPDNLTQNNQNPDIYRRTLNSTPDGQYPQKQSAPQRQPQQTPIQIGPRAPGILPQRSFSPSVPQSPLQSVGSSDQLYKKSNLLDSTENLSHDEKDVKPNRSKINEMVIPSVDEMQFRNEENSSSSSLEFKQKSNKDIETSAVNGKTLIHDDITERPDSKAETMKEQISQPNMHKIEEDDDDSVVTPSRINSSGITLSTTGSTDNISQKSFDLTDSNKQIKNTIFSTNNTPEIKQTAKYNQEIKPISPYTSESKFDHIKPQEIQSSIKHASVTKPNVIPELKSPIYTQPTNANIYTTENVTQKLDYTSEYQNKIQTYGNDNDVVIAPVRNMNAEPRSNTLPPQKPTALLSSVNKKPANESSISANNKEKFMKQSSVKTNLSPTDHVIRKDNKMEKNVPGLRTESYNNSFNKRTLSSKSQRSEGDNDSGVDETTQGKEQSCNGDTSSPRKSQKSSSKSVSASKCKTPIKSLQSPKSPEIANAIPSADKKKIPMNKIQVGSGPSPNLKTIKSKIGSLENATHKPGGGHVKIENKKLDFTKASPRIAAKNDTYTPTGGDKKIVQQKLHWNVKSKIGSLDNASYKPKNSDKKIETVKLDFKEKAKPKVGSKDNLKHIPGGGDVKIDTKKLDIKAQSKIGSLDNVKHKPGGGEIKIFDDKEYLKQRATSSAEFSALSGSQENEGIHHYSYDEPMSLNISAPKRKVRYLDLDGPQSLIDVHRSNIYENQRPMSACSSYQYGKKYKPRTPIPIEERPRWRY